MTHLSLGREGEMIFSRSEWQQVPYKHPGRTLLHHSSQEKGRINLYLQTFFLLFLLVLLLVLF